MVNTDDFSGNTALYKSIADCCRESVIIFDNYGDIKYANSVAIEETGYADGLVGINIISIYPMAFFISEGLLLWDKSLEYMQTFAYRENQTCYPIKLWCKVAKDFENLNFAFGINDCERYDAMRSHRKAMEEVEEATKMKNEFTANVTHELRTPINGIKGMAEGLADSTLLPEQAETVNIILRCCDNMTKIINDLLDFSKIEAGRMELEEREFNFKKFLDETLAFHSTKVNEKGLKLIANIGGNIPDYLIGDELRIGQILNNLLSNAIKFTQNGHVALEVSGTQTEDNGTELFFMVIDSGIGISPEEKDKLFRSFSQVDGSITRRFGGTGLGLAICKQLVGLMEGTISVDSEKGKGSTFSFTVKLKNGKDADSKIDFPVGKFVYEKHLPKVQRLEEEGTEESGTAVFFGEGSFLKKETQEEENERIINEITERLLICIELGSWEKAEGFATLIRNMVPQDNKQLKSTAFSLLLNVRKEEYDKAVQLIEQLQELIDTREEDVEDEERVQ